MSCLDLTKCCTILHTSLDLSMYTALNLACCLGTPLTYVSHHQMCSNQWVLLSGVMEPLQTCFLPLLRHKGQMITAASMWPLILIRGDMPMTSVLERVVMPWLWTQMVCHPT